MRHARLYTLGLAALLLTGIFAGSARAEDCGGLLSEDCGANHWCDAGPGQCGIDNPPGQCVDIGAVCPDLFQPVCGCDAKTYPNNCERQHSKAQLAHDGKCTTE